jgi:hypothetical protein
MLAICDATNTLVGMRNSHGFAFAGCIFLADHALELFRVRLPEQVRAAGLRRMRASGAKICSYLLAQGVDGAVLNPVGPGPVAIPRTLLESIAVNPST